MCAVGEVFAVIGKVVMFPSGAPQVSRVGLSADEYRSIVCQARQGVRMLGVAQIYYLPEAKTIRVVNPSCTLARRFKNNVGMWVGNYSAPFNKDAFSDDLDALIFELGGV